MDKLKYDAYPAIFTYEDSRRIAVVFPDFDAATSGTTDKDALLSAQELLNCVLCGLEADGCPIPVPTPASDLQLQRNERVVLVKLHN